MSISICRAASRFSFAAAFSSSQAKTMLYPSTSRYSGPLSWALMLYFLSSRLVRAGLGWGRKALRSTFP